MHHGALFVRRLRTTCGHQQRLQRRQFLLSLHHFDVPREPHVPIELILSALSRDDELAKQLPDRQSVDLLPAQACPTSTEIELPPVFTS